MADDFIVLGSDGVTAHTMKAKDLGTKKLPGHVLYDEAGAEALGLVTALPAANTIGARLKTIGDVEGATTGAAVVTDVDGTIQQYLRGLVKRWADALGAGTAAAALRVTSASDDPAVTGLGGLTETAPATDTASSGLNGRLQRIAQRLTSLIALVPASLGSKADAAAFAVTKSTEDKALTGALTETAPASDTASSGLNGRLQRIAQRITSMIALLPTALTAGGGLKITPVNGTTGAVIDVVPAGNAADSGSVPVTPSTETKAVFGAITETAPASDTASSGINGRLQRIAQRITSLFSFFGTTADAKSTATDTTAITAMQVWKQISASVQAPPSQAVTNAGTFATQATEESNELRIAGVAVTVKFASISASSSGDNTLVAAVTSKKIRVLSCSLMAAGAVNARFQTAVAGAYLTGLKYFAAAGAGIVLPYNPKGWFETVAGDLLNLELSGAVAVGGELSYIEV